MCDDGRGRCDDEGGDGRRVSREQRDGPSESFIKGFRRDRYGCVNEAEAAGMSAPVRAVVHAMEPRPLLRACVLGERHQWLSIHCTPLMGEHARNRGRAGCAGDHIIRRPGDGQAASQGRVNIRGTAITTDDCAANLPDQATRATCATSR